MYLISSSVLSAMNHRK